MNEVINRVWNELGDIADTLVDRGDNDEVVERIETVMSTLSKWRLPIVHPALGISEVTLGYLEHRHRLKELELAGFSTSIDGTGMDDIDSLTIKVTW